MNSSSYIAQLLNINVCTLKKKGFTIYGSKKDSLQVRGNMIPKVYDPEIN